ncbi:VOC family protein [Flavobacteriaceae bacterium 3-367]|uniref:VOC family protein n=1 Tax=Eudoraea algarum TaxID=3417568 RepID=UPI0032733BA8
MRFNPYLTFNGNCEEAMNFYKAVLNGEFTSLMRFSEAPAGVMQVPESANNLIMHCTLEFEGCTLMASDTLEEHFAQGNHASLTINVNDAGKAETLFNGLLDGGKAIMPFADAFWGGKFGMLTDRFGIQWMLTSDH